jgi:1,5-anhydro-D-fructose reductase (1,5-anhydro-D-mannitol-forming)
MTVSWGIIGCGDVCEKKSGPGFQAARGSRLVAVMRRNAALAADFARRHGVSRWYTDADALVDDPEVDAVYVATPPGSHVEYALRACRAKKPVYVEKPMARSHAESRHLLDAFDRAGVPLFVAYYRRALPRFVRARELIADGSLGTVTSVDYVYAAPGPTTLAPGDLPWRLDAEQSGGGLFLDLGCHTLDVLDFILGPLQGVHGVSRNVSRIALVEDAIAMSFGVAGGAAGTAEWNFASEVETDRLEIRGTRGVLCLSTFGHEPVSLRTSAGDEVFEFPRPDCIEQPLIQTIVDELEGRGSCPSNGQSAARTAWVMDQVLSSYYGGRDDEFWARPGTWPGRARSPE